MEKLPQVKTQELEEQPEMYGPTDQGMILTMLKQQHSGPLPAANQFAQYDQVCPGAGKDIIQYMKDEQAHRQRMDERSIALQEKETLRGQGIGFVLMVIVLGLAAWLGFAGREIIAGAMLTTFVIGMVGKFIDGRSE